MATTATPTQRRVQVLTAHLTSALPNNRPGDSEANPVPTSFFVSGSFAPRSDEKVQRVTLSESILKGHVTPGLQRLLGTFLRIGPNPKYSSYPQFRRPPPLRRATGDQNGRFGVSEFGPLVSFR